ATYACRHLTSGIACGYHSGADDPSDRWPDAWCDLCEVAFQAQGGEWNDVSEAVANIQLMCTHCYDAARARNQDVPPLARGAAASLSDREASELIHHAVHEAQELQSQSDKRWGWLNMPRWDFDPEASRLTFSASDRGTVVADVRLVGSYSTKS